MVAEIHGKDQIMRYYSRPDVAEEYQQLRGGSLFRQIRTTIHAEKIDELLAGQKVKKLLEVGVGTARISRKLRNFKGAWGIDTSVAMLNEARKVLDARWKLKKCDAFHLPFEDNEFDAIVSTRFTWHFNKKERAKLFEELQRVMRPGAIIITDALNAEVERYGFKKTGINGNVFAVKYTPETAEAEFRSYGFSDVRVFPAMYFFGVIKAFSERGRGTYLKSAFRILSKLPLGKPYDYIIAAKKTS